MVSRRLWLFPGCRDDLTYPSFLPFIYSFIIIFTDWANEILRVHQWALEVLVAAAVASYILYRLASRFCHIVVNIKEQQQPFSKFTHVKGPLAHLVECLPHVGWVLCSDRGSIQTHSPLLNVIPILSPTFAVQVKAKCPKNDNSNNKNSRCS